MLAALLLDRKEADELLNVEIRQKTAAREISVSSVEIRDVAIPVALQDARLRQAQAEREKQAPVILGSTKAAIAGKFVEAAAIKVIGSGLALELVAALRHRRRLANVRALETGYPRHDHPHPHP